MDRAAFLLSGPRLCAAVMLAVVVGIFGCDRSDPDRIQGYVEGEFVYVASALPGTLERLFVRRGSQVKVGDPLFVLDSAAEKAAVEQARAALTLSQKEFERLQKLAQANLIAVADLDRAPSATRIGSGWRAPNGSWRRSARARPRAV